MKSYLTSHSVSLRPLMMQRLWTSRDFICSKCKITCMARSFPSFSYLKSNVCSFNPTKCFIFCANWTLTYVRLLQVHLGMVFHRADFRVQYLEPMVTRIKDSGLMDRFFGKWKSPKGMKDHDSLTEEAITIEHIVLPTVFISTGLTLSIVIFLAEIAKNVYCTLMC